MLELERKLNRVLIVDDNADVAISLAMVFRAEGYQAEAAFSAQEAMRKAEQFEPDACLLDIRMPGMNGYELARRLKTLDCHPVLATMTGYSDTQHLDRAVDAGFDLHFTKGTDSKDIIEQLCTEIAAK